MAGCILLRASWVRGRARRARVGMRWAGATGLALAAAILAGCATLPLSPVAPDDPLEQTNRESYRINDWLVRNITLPVAWVTVHVMPKPLVTVVHNVMSNLDAPVVVTNKVLQGKFGDAGHALLRFTVNSTIGLGGIFDAASKAGLPAQHADFGQTLALYGVESGPFLMMPLLGPSTPRDLVGDAVDFALDPLTYLPPGAPFAQRLLTTATVRIVSPFADNARNMVLRTTLAEQSLDPYATMRSVYRQTREREIEGGEMTAPPLDLRGEFDVD